MTVEIFSTEWCQPCKYLTKYLESKNVAYIKHDVEKDREAYQKMLDLSFGSFTVPQILFEGKEILIGFNKGKVDQYIKEMKEVNNV